ncbi:MAG: hypothetical protein WAP74_01345 [Patescibacteria group bacterium]
MRFVRNHAGLLLTIAIFLVFVFWIGSYLGGAVRTGGSPTSDESGSPSVSISEAVNTSPTPSPSTEAWATREFKQFNIKLDVPESWPTVLEQGGSGIRFVNPANNKELLGLRVHAKNARDTVKNGLTITKETALVIAGQAASVLDAERKNEPGGYKVLLTTNFGKLYELYGQAADFDRFVHSINFVTGELPAVKSYKTTGCNVSVDYPDSWYNREIFGPPGAATIVGFDPKPIPESGESSGKIQLSCITGQAAARYRANFEAFHKEVKSEKVPLAQFEALKLTGRVPEDAPAAANEQRLQVVLERDESAGGPPGGRTYIITYTSPKDSFEADRKGLIILTETIEFQ